MREILGKIGRFCENHVEKLVLVVVGVFCAWLFFTWVIFSPNVVTIDGKQFGPSQIDKYVLEKAKELDGLLPGSGTGGAPTGYVDIMSGPIDPNDPVVADVFLARPKPESFVSLFESPLSYMALAQTGLAGGERIKDRPKYLLPSVGHVTEVAVNHIRAAAYVPLTEVDAKNPYDDAVVEPNDVDLVTVEGKFDVANLYRQFRAHFAGTEVEKQQWRDPCLAEPTFAAVQLQRQTLLEDGTWSDWAQVPRSRIEANRELFSVIEDVDDLPPGGMGVRLMQYDSPFIAKELLQPSSYQIASAEEDWFPPSFYEKFKALQRKVDLEERRKEREQREDERDRDNSRSGRRDTTTRTTTRDRTSGAGGRRRDATGGAGTYGGTGGRSTRSRSRTTNPGGNAMAGGRRDRRSPGGPGLDMGMGAYDPAMGGAGMRLEPTTDEVYIEFAENMLTYRSDMSKLDKPLLVWGFDDTTEPGHSYRYRLRVGVFNPVAGTDKVADRDADKKDQVILWTDFSDVTDAVHVPNRLYFFAKNVQDRTKTATVEVARYTLGYWRTEDFQVKPGEVIGKEMEPKDEKEDDRSSRLRDRMTPGRGPDMAMGMGPGGTMMAPVGLGVEPRLSGAGAGDQVTRPDIIDFRTHAVLIDLVEVNDLGPQFQPRGYYDMLYTGDGAMIEHMPVNSANWPKNMLATYQQIKGQERIEQQPFRAFGDSGVKGRQGAGMDMMDGGLYGQPY